MGEVNIPTIINCDTEMINAVIDPVTGEQKESLQLDEVTREIWDPAICLEIAWLLGIGTMRFIPQSGVPKGKKVVYLQIAVDIRDHKRVWEQVCIVVGGDQIDFEVKAMTCTVDMTTVKMHLQNMLLTVGAKYMNLDLKNFI